MGETYKREERTNTREAAKEALQTPEFLPHVRHARHPVHAEHPSMEAACPIFNVFGMTRRRPGVEPLTSRTLGRCSTPVSHRAVILLYYDLHLEIIFNWV